MEPGAATAASRGGFTKCSSGGDDLEQDRCGDEPVRAVSAEKACFEMIDSVPEDANSIALLTAVENGGAGSVSRRSKMAAHNRAGLWAGRIGATAPITPPFRERHRSALRHGDLERDTP